MDHYNFHMPHDSGWWSLHTEGSRFDVWHTLKIFKWAFVFLAIAGKDAFIYSVVLTYAILNYFIHEILFHKILRRNG
jgi:hypothetical protein